MKIMNKGKVKIGKIPSRFDDSIALGYPSRDGWAALYRRLQPALVNSLSKGYSYADREDAIEEAFNKLMHKYDDCSARLWHAEYTITSSGRGP